jgi:hypothetical protein
MPLTINELLDKAIEHARATLIDKPDAQLIPTWLIQAKDRTTVVGTPWDGDDDKRIMLFAIRMMLKKEKAQSYSFMSEAWMATEDLKHPIGLQPREREDRKEAVIMNAFDRDGGGKMRIYDIQRGDNGRVSDLVLQQTEADHFSGRMFNLFRDSHAD